MACVSRGWICDQGNAEAAFLNSEQLIRTLFRSLALGLVNRLDTALHITVLLHGLYVGVIPIGLHWHDQMVGSHWHDQLLIELGSVGLNCEN